MCKGLTIDDVGVSTDTAFQEIRPAAGFETGDFGKEKLGRLPWNDSYSKKGYKDFHENRDRRWYLSVRGILQ